MPASTYVGDLVLNAVLCGVAPALPTRLFVALHTADPGLNGDNEVQLTSWPNYQRKDAAVGGAIGIAFTPSFNKASYNQNKLDYGVMDGAASLTITHFAVWDAALAGRLYIYGPLLDAKTLAPTDECLINPNKLQATVV